MKVLRRSAIFALTLNLLLAPNVINAQEEAPLQFERIKGLEPLVGSWIAETFTIAGEESERGEGQVFLCQWTSRKSYLHCELSRQRGGERRSIVGTVLIGQDHARDQVSQWGFWENRQTYGTVDIEEGAAIITESAEMLNGRKMSSKVTMRVDGDQLIVTFTDRKMGDESLPEIQRTFKRG